MSKWFITIGAIIGLAAGIVIGNYIDAGAPILIVPFLGAFLGWLLWLLLLWDISFNYAKKLNKAKKNENKNDLQNLINNLSKCDYEIIGHVLDKIIDCSIIAEIYNNSTIPTYLRHYHCKRVQHDWDGCTCKRCEIVHDDDYGRLCECKRCGAENHDWETYTTGPGGVEDQQWVQYQTITFCKKCHKTETTGLNNPTCNCQ
ncbi:MAG: hypothetical protein LBC82_05380 [Oscillospiraceae bacterium]|jgi:hypothetical protein|nr:hypothetical protein [Oscillospiraceae bacterium]